MEKERLMSEWNRMRKQNRNLESMILIIIAACFLLGGWCDWNALVKEKAWIFINDIDAFSLTILQIQASTATLIIAIIALITGNISDSYMGVSVSDFYLNINGAEWYGFLIKQSNYSAPLTFCTKHL